MAILIRAAVAADAAVLAQLRYDFRASTAPPTEAEAAFVQRCERWMVRALGQAHWFAWLAEVDGVARGNLWLQTIEKLPNPADERELHAYITNVYVDPAHRGGIGELLMRAAMAWCRERLIDSVILWPTAGSRSLYARHGFAVRDDLMEAVLDDGRLGGH